MSSFNNRTVKIQHTTQYNLRQGNEEGLRGWRKGSYGVAITDNPSKTMEKKNTKQNIEEKREIKR
jgi:hypothetical protein